MWSTFLHDFRSKFVKQKEAQRLEVWLDNKVAEKKISKKILKKLDLFVGQYKRDFFFLIENFFYSRKTLTFPYRHFLKHFIYSKLRF